MASRRGVTEHCPGQTPTGSRSPYPGRQRRLQAARGPGAVLGLGSFTPPASGSGSHLHTHSILDLGALRPRPPRTRRGSQEQKPVPTPPSTPRSTASRPPPDTRPRPCHWPRPSAQVPSRKVRQLDAVEEAARRTRGRGPWRLWASRAGQGLLLGGCDAAARGRRGPGPQDRSAGHWGGAQRRWTGTHVPLGVCGRDAGSHRKSRGELLATARSRGRGALLWDGGHLGEGTAGSGRGCRPRGKLKMQCKLPGKDLANPGGDRNPEGTGLAHHGLHTAHTRTPLPAFLSPAHSLPPPPPALPPLTQRGSTSLATLPVPRNASRLSKPLLGLLSAGVESLWGAQSTPGGSISVQARPWCPHHRPQARPLG